MPIRTNQVQKDALRFSFIECEAHKWTDQLRDAAFKQYLDQEMFINLKISHIRYQWFNFKAETLFRLGLGQRFEWATNEMNDVVIDKILGVLSQWRLKFCASGVDEIEELIGPIPDKLNGFLLICSKVWLERGVRPDFELDVSTFEGVYSFAKFIIGHLLPMFANLWREFSAIEIKPKAPFTNRPDLAIAALELLLNLCMKELTETNTQMVACFYQETFAICVDEVDGPNLYAKGSLNDAEWGVGTDYIRQAMVGNKHELKNTLFVSFCEAVFQWYTDSLPLIAAKMESPEDSMSTNSTYEERDDVLNMGAIGSVEVTGKEMHELHNSEDLNVQHQQIVYYIAGAAFHKILDTFPHGGDTKEAKLALEYRRALLSSLTIDEDRVDKTDLPTGLVKMRMRTQLHYVCRELYDITIRFEESIIKPLLTNSRQLAMLGNSYGQYVQSIIGGSGFEQEFAGLFCSAMLSKYGDVLQPDKDVLDKVESLAHGLACRYIKYYVSTSFNDFTAIKFRELGHDMEIDRALNHRTKVLTGRAVNEDLI